MPSEQDKEFARYITDLMQCIGPVNSRAMFGGFGFFLDGVMIALLSQRSLYLKADKQSAAAFTELGLSAFTYSKQGKPFQMSFYEAPETIYEDSDAMCEWGNRAYAAALRAKR